MIADALRVEIERYAARCRTQNPLLGAAKKGLLTREHVVRYLVNVKHLVSHTPVHLARARERAAALGDERLAMHFANRLQEEVGHDQWAEDDIAAIERVNARSMSDADISPGMKALLRTIEVLIDRDPSLYLSYILLAEYLTVLVGPEFLDDLESFCGIPKSSMSVIANHAELDKDHTEEAFENIDDLVGDPRKLPVMRAALLESIERFERFTLDMATLPLRRVTPEYRVSAA